jgi:hypothetical protein
MTSQNIYFSSWDTLYNRFDTVVQNGIHIKKILLENLFRTDARIYWEIYLHYKEDKFKRRFWGECLFDIDCMQEKEN